LSYGASISARQASSTLVVLSELCALEQG